MGCNRKAEPCGSRRKGEGRAAAPGPGIAAKIDRPDGHGSRMSLRILSLSREREGLCEVCEFRRSCLIGSDPIVGREARRDPAEDCWAGLWPDSAGVVRRGGIRYAGIPKALRIRLGLRAAWRAFRRHTSEGGEYPGCGCFLFLLEMFHVEHSRASAAAAWIRAKFKRQ